MGVLSRAWRLSWTERKDLLQAWLGLLAADLALKALPLARVERLFAPSRPGGLPLAAVPVDRLVWAVRAASRHHLRPMPCLPRAVCLRWLLGRHGIAAELRIGVTREGGGLAAHAWVEHAGRPVGDEADVADRFAPLSLTSPS